MISGATFKTYIVTQADVGHRLRVRVSVANSEGTATETSNATAIVRAAPVRPANTAPPTITGTPQVGKTLTATNGTWTGQPLTFTYQWQRCNSSGGSCANIGGARSKTYTLTTVDQGNTLRVWVTARNSAGTASATSAPTAVILKAEAPSGFTVQISEVSLPNRLLIDRVQFLPQPLRSRRTFTARFHVSDSHNHSVQGALVFVVALPFGTTTTPPGGRDRPRRMGHLQDDANTASQVRSTRDRHPDVRPRAQVRRATHRRASPHDAWSTSALSRRRPPNWTPPPPPGTPGGGSSFGSPIVLQLEPAENESTGNHLSQRAH